MAQSAGNAANYELEKVRAKTAARSKVAQLTGVGFTVSYSTSNDTVTINLAGQQTFPKGGVLVVSTAVASATGRSLGQSDTLAISTGGKNIGLA
jgi:hypothetical protein